MGPLRLGYGNVVAAGTILRQDFHEENKLIVGKSHSGTVVDFHPRAYAGLSRVLENNFLYLANLRALEEWYASVRRDFFRGQELGELIYSGLSDNLASARKERIKRLNAMADKIRGPIDKNSSGARSNPGRQEFLEHVERACELFNETTGGGASEHRDRFLSLLYGHRKDRDGSYVEVIKSLPAAASKEGTLWLDTIVLGLCRRIAALFPTMGLFKKMAT